MICKKMKKNYSSIVFPKYVFISVSAELKYIHFMDCSVSTILISYCFSLKQIKCEFCEVMNINFQVVILYRKHSCREKHMLSYNLIITCFDYFSRRENKSFRVSVFFNC